LGLYYIALRHYQHAVDTLQKALFISSDDVSATVYLSKLYLDPEARAKLRPASNTPMLSSASSTASTTQEAPTVNSDVDLAAGILAYLTKGRGWDAPEAWYYLAKAYGMQGRKQKERETLRHALELSEKRGVRDIGLALGWCV
jgi:tetratricopeptide (TPR) repeat protein